MQDSGSLDYEGSTWASDSMASTAAPAACAASNATAALPAAGSPALPYLQLVLAFIVTVHLLHTWLDVRQLRALRKPSLPPALASLFTPDQYKASQSYAIDKWWFGTVQGTAGLVENVAFLACGVLPWLWSKTGSIPGVAEQGEVVHTVAFVACLTLISAVWGLPWAAYSTFVIEQRHGFNKQQLGLFVSDFSKSLLLGALLLPPLVTAFTYILMHSGPWLPLYLWAFVLGLSLVMMMLAPSIMALFNKFEPLPEGSLRTGIEDLASMLKYPLKKLYSVDGSKRSAHSNAYMYGFGSNKRIVLYDTLINQSTEEEVVAVLAHELGHWKLRHTPVMFAMGQAVMLLNFLLFMLVRNSNELYEAFGFIDHKPAFLSFVLFTYLLSPLDEVLGLLNNLVSRTFEFQADGFAVGLGKGSQLRSALLKMQTENKSSMSVDPLYSTFHYSHPPLEERLKAIDKAMQLVTKSKAQ